MELERTEMAGYEAVFTTTLTQEETLETIVPDACPDIARIVDTECTLFLKHKEVTAGRVEVTGTAKTAVLYLPDGMPGLRRMEVAIPFTFTLENGQLTPRCCVIAKPRIKTAETRMLNPRKILTRVDLILELQVFAPSGRQLCTGVSGDQAEQIAQRKEQYSVSTVVSVQEKQFSFSDDVSIPGGRPEAEEILKNRVDILCNESKIIGNKLIFKGEASVQIVYRASSGMVSSAGWNMPFSQIMELAAVSEEAAAEISVQAMGTEISVDPMDGRSVSVSMNLTAEAVIREKRALELLTDAYGVGCAMRAELYTDTLSALFEADRRREGIRELIETVIMPQTIVDAYVTIGMQSQRRNGQEVILAVETQVTVLYLSEDDALLSVSRKCSAESALTLPEEVQCQFSCVCPEAVTATPASGGVEVRYPVEFQITVTGSQRVVLVKELVPLEKTADQGNQPSIVLRVVDDGERIWDVAKLYGTTVEEIMRANGLENETPNRGDLLLIPRKR